MQWTRTVHAEHYVHEAVAAALLMNFEMCGGGVSCLVSNEHCASRAHKHTHTHNVNVVVDTHAPIWFSHEHGRKTSVCVCGTI